MTPATPSTPSSVSDLRVILVGCCDAGHEVLLGTGNLRLDTFWVQFGAWCAARGERPAEQSGMADATPLPDSIIIFLSEQARRCAGAVVPADLSWPAVPNTPQTVSDDDCARYTPEEDRLLELAGRFHDNGARP